MGQQTAQPGQVMMGGATPGRSKSGLGQTYAGSWGMAGGNMGPVMQSNPAMPTPGTGSEFDRVMQQRLSMGTPEDMALQQRMMMAEMQRGRGPVMQGPGRPGWQQTSGLEAMTRFNNVPRQGASNMGPRYAR